jgi:hypothetical protein
MRFPLHTVCPLCDAPVQEAKLMGSECPHCHKTYFTTVKKCYHCRTELTREEYIDQTRGAGDVVLVCAKCRS